MVEEQKACDTQSGKKWHIKDSISDAINRGVEGLFPGPHIIFVPDSKNWRTLFDIEPAVIDALKISAADLYGTDYRNRSFFKPAWYQDFMDRKALVVENLCDLPPQSEDDPPGFSRIGDSRPGQIDFLFLFRDQFETGPYRSLNSGSPYSVPVGAAVFTILDENSKSRIVEPILRRCGILRWNYLDE